MSNQHEEVNVGSTIWQSQTADAPRISLEFVHHQSQKLQRSMSNERNIFYISSAAASVIGLVSIFKHWIAGDKSPMNIVFDVSTLLFVLALASVMFYLRQHLWIKQVVRDSDVAGGLAVYRAELERLVKLAYQEWRVLLYAAPSYLTLLIGGLIFDQRPGKLLRYGAMIAAGVAGTCFAFWAGRKKTRCLQRELDAIASLK